MEANERISFCVFSVWIIIITLLKYHIIKDIIKKLTHYMGKYVILFVKTIIVNNFFVVNEELLFISQRVFWTWSCLELNCFRGDYNSIGSKSHNKQMLCSRSSTKNLLLISGVKIQRNWRYTLYNKSICDKIKQPSDIENFSCYLFKFYFRLIIAQNVRSEDFIV